MGSLLLGSLLVVGCALPVSAEDLKARVDKIVKPYLENEVAAGFAIGIIDGDKVTLLNYGHVTDEKSGPPDSNTVFEIGSITKVFTGILLADMIERKEVRLEDPVSKLLLDTVKIPGKGDRAITLLDLTTHTAGLPSLPDNMTPKDPNNPYADYTVQQMYDYLSKATLSREPGAQYEYSNLGVGLLGHALARKAGMSYEELVMKRICEPLGMKETRITLTADMQKRMAKGHNADGDPAQTWDLPTFAGAGALRSTVNDMLRFVKANMGVTETPLQPVLKAAQVLRRPAVGQESIAFGWHIRDKKIWWHNGGTGGYHSFIGFNPERKQGVVILNNTFVPSLTVVGFDLLKLLAGEEITPPAMKTLAKVKPETLAKYVGEYELAPGFVLTVTRDGDKLRAQATGQPRFRIYPESETKFFWRVVEARLTFVTNGDGKVGEAVLNQNGQELHGKKIR